MTRIAQCTSHLSSSSSSSSSSSHRSRHTLVLICITFLLFLSYVHADQHTIRRSRHLHSDSHDLLHHTSLLQSSSRTSDLLSSHDQLQTFTDTDTDAFTDTDTNSLLDTETGTELDALMKSEADTGADADADVDADLDTDLDTDTETSFATSSRLKHRHQHKLHTTVDIDEEPAAEGEAAATEGEAAAAPAEGEAAAAPAEGGEAAATEGGEAAAAPAAEGEAAATEGGGEAAATEEGGEAATQEKPAKKSTSVKSSPSATAASFIKDVFGNVEPETMRISELLPTLPGPLSTALSWLQNKFPEGDIPIQKAKTSEGTAIAITGINTQIENIATPLGVNLKGKLPFDNVKIIGIGFSCNDAGSISGVVLSISVPTFGLPQPIAITNAHGTINTKRKFITMSGKIQVSSLDPIAFNTKFALPDKATGGNVAFDLVAEIPGDKAITVTKILKVAGLNLPPLPGPLAKIAEIGITRIQIERNDQGLLTCSLAGKVPSIPFIKEVFEISNGAFIIRHQSGAGMTPKFSFRPILNWKIGSIMLPFDLLTPGNDGATKTFLNLASPALKQLPMLQLPNMPDIKRGVSTKTSQWLAGGVSSIKNAVSDAVSTVKKATAKEAAPEEGGGEEAAAAFIETVERALTHGDDLASSPAVRGGLGKVSELMSSLGVEPTIDQAAKRLNIQELMKAARLYDLVPKDIIKWLEERGMLKFQLDLAAFQVALNPFMLHVAGQTDLWGKTGFEIVGGMTGEGQKVFGFSLTSKGDTNGGLRGLIKTLMRVDLDIFESSTFSFLMVASDVDLAKYPEFRLAAVGDSVKLQRGLFVRAAAEFSKKNPLMKFLADKSKKTKFILDIAFQPGIGFSLIGDLDDLPLTKSLTLTRLHLAVIHKTSQPLNIYVDAHAELSLGGAKKVPFRGVIKYQNNAVRVELTMIDPYQNAFGIQKLSFSNLVANIDVSKAGAVIAFTGTITFQKLSGTVDFGLNTQNPDKNYFIAKIKPVTLKEIIEMFCSTKLPAILDKIGILSLELSYSKTAQTIINPLGKELSVKAGFTLLGSINIGKLIANIDLNYYNEVLKVVISTPKVPVKGISLMKLMGLNFDIPLPLESFTVDDLSLIVTKGKITRFYGQFTVDGLKLVPPFHSKTLQLNFDMQAKTLDMKGDLFIKKLGPIMWSTNIKFPADGQKLAFNIHIDIKPGLLTVGNLLREAGVKIPTNLPGPLQAINTISFTMLDADRQANGHSAYTMIATIGGFTLIPKILKFDQGHVVFSYICTPGCKFNVKPVFALSIGKFKTAFELELIDGMKQIRINMLMPNPKSAPKLPSLPTTGGASEFGSPGSGLDYKQLATKLKMQLSTPKFSLSDAIASMGGDANNAFVKLINFEIEIWEFSVQVKPDFRAKIGAMIAFFGIQTDFQLIVGSAGPNKGLALGVTTRQTLLEIIQKICKFKLDAFTSSGLMVMVSTVQVDTRTFPDWKLLALGTRDVIYKGFTIQCSVGLNPNHNPLFKVMAKVMPKLNIYLNIQPNMNIRIEATIDPIPLSKHLKIIDVGFTLDIQPSTPLFKVALQGGIEFPVNGKKCKFTAEVSVTLPSVTFKVAMKFEGFIENMFGIKGLRIGNLYIAVGINPALVPSFEFEASMFFGKLGGTIAFRIDPATPKANFFYGELKPFTLGEIIRGFNPKANVPGLIADSGFPKGLLISFAFQETTLQASKIVVPAGFVFKGKIVFLKLGADIDFRMNPFNLELRLEISLDPLILLGGRLKLLRSKGDTKHGPRGLLEINKGFQVAFAAYMQFFGLEVGVDFAIGPLFFKLHVQIKTPVFFISVRIEVKGDVKDLKNSRFTFELIFDMTELYRKVLAAINWFFEQGYKAIAAADGGVKKAQEKLRSTAKGICDPVKSCGIKCPKLKLHRFANTTRTLYMTERDWFDAEVHAVLLETQVGWGWAKKALKSVGNAFKKVGKAIVNTAKKIGNAIKSAVLSVWEALKKFAEAIKKLGFLILNTVMSGFCKLATAMCAAACGLVKLALEAAAVLLSAARAALAVVKLAWSAIHLAAKAIINGFQLHYMRVYFDVSHKGFTFEVTIKGIIVGIKFSLNFGISLTSTKIGDIAKGIWNGIKNNVKKAFGLK